MKRSKFHLEKWFLDFVGNTNDETMIFYAARLTFMGIVVQYAHWIHYDSVLGRREQSHFRKVMLPNQDDKLIHWKDDIFGVSGTWQGTTSPLNARIFEDEEGVLDWHCFQPAATIQLVLKGKPMEGVGYAEKLTLTTFPWRIPMQDLRWGRFHSQDEQIVWIELRDKISKQWVWWNGEKQSDCQIEDHGLVLNEHGVSLTLDCGVVLEFENRIAKVTDTINRFLPGFKRLMPSQFFGAQSKKWLSKGKLFKQGTASLNGVAIHEWVCFNGTG